MTRTEVQASVRLLCSSLEVGGSMRVTCPVCHKRTMSCTRDPLGILYTCHRASCEAKGFAATAAHTSFDKADRKPEKKMEPYRGALMPPGVADEEYFAERFELEITAHNLRVTEYDEYALQMRTPTGMNRGYIIRQPNWKGEPVPPRKGKDNPDYPKTVMYQETPGPGLSWWGKAPGTIVLVEDIISAMKLGQHGYRAAALLGTHMDARRVREIGQQHPEQVLLAFDEDATANAFRMGRKWGLSFNKLRVVMLERDLKDEEAINFREILGC